MPIDTVTTINTEKNNTNTNQTNLKLNNENQINISNITSNSANISWDKGNSKFIQYNIYQFNWITSDWDLFDYAYEKTYKLTNLLPSTPYKYQIRVNIPNALIDMNEIIVGEIMFYTKPEATTLSLISSSTKEISLSWDDIELASSYLLYKGETNDNLIFSKELTKDSNTYIDTEVNEGQTYYYKIICSYSAKDYTVKSEDSNIVSVEVPTLQPMSLPPETSGICKTYAYYTAVTVKNSPQYAVLNSGTWNGVEYETYTDETTGIRMVDDCYCAALGSFYGTKMGTKYLVTLESGKTFKIILCDSKADRHTDSTNRYALQNKDIVEFYVEPGKVPYQVNGSYNSLPEFNGPIKSIEKIS